MTSFARQVLGFDSQTGTWVNGKYVGHEPHLNLAHNFMRDNKSLSIQSFKFTLMVTTIFEILVILNHSNKVGIFQSSHLQSQGARINPEKECLVLTAIDIKILFSELNIN